MDLVLQVHRALANLEQSVDGLNELLVVGIAHFFNFNFLATDKGAELVQEGLHLVIPVDILDGGSQMLQVLGIVRGIRDQDELLDVKLGHGMQLG